MTRRALPAAFVGVAFVAACGSATPPHGTYTIAFQSTAQAVAADAVHVQVFDASSIDACVELLVAESQANLPAAKIDVPPASPCELDRGVGAVSLPFGNVAVLVLATRAGKVIARGCATQEISDATPNLVVSVANVGGTPPTTSCGSLAQHCAHGC